MKTEIKIKVLGIDDGDDVIMFQAFFNNGLCSTTIEFYGYADIFQDFANELIEFPKTIKDRVTFKIGEKGSKWAYYLLLEAYCFRRNGLSSLNIETANNGVGPGHFESKFGIELEPASLNRLGRELINWDPLQGETFVWTPKE